MLPTACEATTISVITMEIRYVRWLRLLKLYRKMMDLRCEGKRIAQSKERE